MAEFVLAPRTLSDDESNKALLFFSKQLLAKEQADLKQKFETLTQGILQIPFFVADRSQTFEHKQKRSGPGAHSHMRECMVEELDLFLPSDLPKNAMKEHAKVQLDLKDNVAATVTSEHAFPYLQCEKKPTSLQLKACFVYIPPWDESSLQVHYVSLSIRQKEKSFLNREEVLEVEGKRSVMKFSMIRSTAIQVMSALEAKDKLMKDEIKEFHDKTNKYDSLSTLEGQEKPPAEVPQKESSSCKRNTRQPEPTKSKPMGIGITPAAERMKEEGKEQTKPASESDGGDTCGEQKEQGGPTAEAPQKESPASDGNKGDNQFQSPALTKSSPAMQLRTAPASAAPSTECPRCEEKDPTESVSSSDEPMDEEELTTSALQKTSGDDKQSLEPSRMEVGQQNAMLVGSTDGSQQKN